MSSTATDYLRDVFASLDKGYPADCVTHACRIAELLLAEGKSPWIGRLRDVSHGPDGTIHGPLTPRRLAGRQGPTWTTHYIACAEGFAYDPLEATPLALAAYSVCVFGRALAIETFLTPTATAEGLRSGVLRAEFRPKRGGSA